MYSPPLSATTGEDIVIARTSYDRSLNSERRNAHSLKLATTPTIHTARPAKGSTIQRGRASPKVDHGSEPAHITYRTTAQIWRERTHMPNIRSARAIGPMSG